MKLGDIDLLFNLCIYKVSYINWLAFSSEHGVCLQLGGLNDSELNVFTSCKASVMENKLSTLWLVG